MSETVSKALLKSLCCGNGWSYAVFWGLNQQNPLLLTLIDAYCEEQMSGLIDDMLLQVHIIGSGVIGQVAFTQKHKWMISDSNSVLLRDQCLAHSFELLQEDSELFGQFSCGIKTVAVISVEPFGVVQFGSNQKLPESTEFVDKTKNLFRGINIESVLPEILPSSANEEVFGHIESLPSSIINSPYFQTEAFCEETQTDFTSNYFNFEGSSLTSLQENISSNNVFCAFPDHFEYITDTIQTDELAQTQASLWSYDVSQSCCPVVEQTDDISCVTNAISTSSNSNAFNSSRIERYSNTSFFNNCFRGFECKMPDIFDNIVKPATTSNSCCTSEHSIGSKDRLFSKLGIDHFLNDNPSTSNSFVGSSCDDRLSYTKKTRIEGPLVSSHSLRPSDLCSLRENLKSFDRSVNTRAGNEVKEHENASKPVKKKAKRGTRPIPKDRIRTYERLAELRELIPNGEKMSIDRLLHQTIKQLLFLQSVTRRAEGLKNTEELKDRKSEKDKASGVTWACEIENQTMVCPLIVEDLCTPGQMLIEVLCQEQGFFLEIVDIIRGFGLNILKGTMEHRGTKIWAHFMVEAEENRFVSRHDIFSSLLQLFQLSGTSDSRASDQLGNARDGSNSTMNHCLELPVPFPISSLY